MMISIKTVAMTAAIAMASLATPAMAQSLGDTHQMHWNQTGKIPAVHYRPLKKACVQQADPIHLSGKTPLIVRDKSGANCGTSIASRNADKTTDRQ